MASYLPLPASHWQIVSLDGFADFLKDFLSILNLFFLDFYSYNPCHDKLVFDVFEKKSFLKYATFNDLNSFEWFSKDSSICASIKLDELESRLPYFWINDSLRVERSPWRQKELADDAYGTCNDAWKGATKSNGIIFWNKESINWHFWLHFDIQFLNFRWKTPKTDVCCKGTPIRMAMTWDSLAN